jgi:hypothetical protein
MRAKWSAIKRTITHHRKWIGWSAVIAVLVAAVVLDG